MESHRDSAGGVGKKTQTTPVTYFQNIEINVWVIARVVLRSPRNPILDAPQSTGSRTGSLRVADGHSLETQPQFPNLVQAVVQALDGVAVSRLISQHPIGSPCVANAEGTDANLLVCRRFFLWR